MTHVVLAIGSNIDRERNIDLALRGLKPLGTLEVSPIVESDPVGYDSTSRFYNLVIGVETTYSQSALHALCKALERQSGRCPNEPRFSPKTLDIDLLLWGDLITDADSHPCFPHPDILRYAHVLCPLSLLYPTAKHPIIGASYQVLWENKKAALPTLQQLPPPIF